MATKNDTLRGKRVAVLATDGFEYVELSVPVTALRAAGARVAIVSLHDGKIRGMNLTVPTKTVHVDEVLGKTDPATYDALLVPGGYVSPDFLRQSREARDFVRAFDEAKKPIATLCHGPWVLASAGLVGGRVLASWPGVRDDIVHAGGTWRDEAVVRDRNWVSSRGPEDLDAFVPAMIELFASGATLSVPTPLPSSPQADEPPRPALTAARVIPGPAAWALGVLGAAAAVGAIARWRASV